MIQYSIIIPSYNGASRILTTLNSIVKQTISCAKYEIVVVIDGSTDKTINVLKQFRKKHLNLHIRYKSLKNKNGAAFARNTGIRMARGDILFFIDDDCEAPSFWMKKFINIYHKYPDVVGVGGWLTPPVESLQKNIFEQFIYLRYRFLWGKGLDSTPGKTGELHPLPAINGGNFSVKKGVFYYAGLFNPNLDIGMEDVDLSFRIQKKGFILYYLPIMMIHNKQNNTLFKFLTFCINRTQGKKQYNYEYNLPNTIIANRYNKFVEFCQQLDKKKLPFPYNSKVTLLAFIYFYMEMIIMKIPYSYKKSL